MRDSIPALILYTIAVIIAVLGIVLDNEILLLFSKPVIVPAIFFYYVQTTKISINWFFTIGLFCHFLDDIISLLNFGNTIYFVIIFNAVNFLILLYFRIKDIEPNFINSKRKIYILMATLINSFILFFVLNLINIENETLNFSLYIYGFILWALASLSAFHFYSSNSLRNTFAALMCGCFIISNVSYAVYNFYINIEIFKILNLIMQSASYFYMVKYFTSKKIYRSDIEFDD
ncbi:hypothetical protein [Flavobacterium sp.]|uniref:hypothetical protein n=1 Tax=Flavobacterium sp. TaxID=239 RepID=UPI00286CA991|nr:hypothetical protein [Flavobacterium sp.]